MSDGAVPVVTKDPPTQSDAGGDTSLIPWLVKHGPKWARTPARVAGFFIAAVPSVVLLFHLGNDIPAKIANSPAAMQLQMAADADISGRSATFHFLEQKAEKGIALTLDEQMKLLAVGKEMDHQLKHQNNPKDDVKWVTFAQEDKNDYFGYKLYPSDRCLVIARVEKGNTAKVEWLRDPVAPQPERASKLPGAASFDGIQSFARRDQQHLHSVSDESRNSTLAPSPVQKPIVRDIALQFSLSTGFVPPPERVQAGCINPHPWPYQQTVGPALNQCQAPVYRQWADGCSHVQIFDHCQNFWGPVVWQFCAANHHP